MSSSSSSVQELGESSSSHQHSPLLNLNEHCLLNICKYLNITDIKNLASTCYGLRNFVRIWSILPKLSKSLKLYMTDERSRIAVLDVNYCTMTVSEVKAHILNIGNYVEHLSVTTLRRKLLKTSRRIQHNLLTVLSGV